MSNDEVEINFNPETGRFLLQVSKEDVGLGEKPVTFRGKTFSPKEEVHITITGGVLAERLSLRFRTDRALEGEFRQAIAATSWRYRVEDEWYHVVCHGEGEKGDAESIVRMVTVPPLSGFYRRLETLFGMQIPERPAHVTLYTWNDAHGIGIATWDLFNERVQRSVSPALWQ